jgi:hypothetical protein
MDFRNQARAERQGVVWLVQLEVERRKCGEAPKIRRGIFEKFNLGD